jgi:hypothetical protein
MKPDTEVEKLIFEKTTDYNKLKILFDIESVFDEGGFNEIYWFNTPGPIYTTFTDNCGTGQIEAPDNVSGDEDYHELIFKQPMNLKELKEVIGAASVDPFGAYFIDGNKYWNYSKIEEWWKRSKDRIDFIIKQYKTELSFDEGDPHLSRWDFDGEIKELHLFGPFKPIPENYKAWLDFYQHNMKDYLEWYIYKLEGKIIRLPELNYDWTSRICLDQEFYNRADK